MQRQARQEGKGPYEEALGKGMSFFQSYPIAGRGNVYVVTDKIREDFTSDEAFLKYIYDNRRDGSKVRFINKDNDYLYRSGSEQDRLAKEIMRQEEVEIAPPFQKAAREEGEEQLQTRSISVNYGGMPVRMRIDVTGMSGAEREALQADIDSIRFRPRGEARFDFENDFFNFIDKYLDYFTEIKAKGVSVRLDEGTISQLDELARRG